MNIIQAIEHPDVFQPLFRDPAQWGAWFSFLRVLFGLETTEADCALFKECTGRQEPRGPYTEAWLVCGRRSGKSYTMALIAVFLAAFRDYRPYLAPGERGTIMILAADRKQARNCLRYIRGMLSLPVLKALVVRETADSFDLDNQVTIEVGTANFKTVRGYTLVAALCDEIAFWESGDAAANPDEEILSALRPAMVTIPGAMLICASNPHGKFGALWKTFERHYGKDASRTLVWRASTRTMHPEITQEFIDAAIEDDPEKGRAEYLAEFRSDLAKFIDRDLVEALVVKGRHEEPPIPGVEYVAFCDPSGGAADSFTLAIACRKDVDDDGEGVGVLACLREFPAPFSPDSVVTEIAATLRAYDIHEVTGDRYGGEWPPDRFSVHGINYETSELNKSEIYREALPLLMQGRIEFLDHKRLIAQTCSLERRTARGGRDTIDHPAGGHDDCANAACGALLLAAGKRSASWIWKRIGAGAFDALTQRLYGK